MNEFDGEVPADVGLLQRLPGVGRKTANVIASCIFNQPKMAVDTHVFRVAARLGLTRGAKNPLQAELQLIKHIPEEQISLAHHWLILHARYVGLGELAAKYLHKGSLVHIEGSLRTRSWEDKDKNRRFMTEIIASNLVMLDKRNTGDVKHEHEDHPNLNTVPHIDSSLPLNTDDLESELPF